MSAPEIEEAIAAAGQRALRLLPSRGLAAAGGSRTLPIVGTAVAICSSVVSSIVTNPPLDTHTKAERAGAVVGKGALEFVACTGAVSGGYAIAAAVLPAAVARRSGWM
jgi:hypothetical protein